MATLLSEVPVRACLCGDIYAEDHKFFMDVCKSNVCCETFFADGSVNKKKLHFFSSSSEFEILFNHLLGLVKMRKSP